MYKYSIILTLSIALLSSCHKTNDEKAIDLVETYCKGNFFYSDSYKPWSFEHLEAYYQPYEHTAGYHKLVWQKQQLEHRQDSIMRLSASNKKAIYMHQADSINLVLGQINKTIAINKESFRGEQEGWQVIHNYVKRNDFGTLIQYRTVFIIDKNLTRVLETQDK